MDRVPIPEHDVVPIDAVAAGVRGLRILLVNVYAVSGPNGSWTLIDAGLPFSAEYIRGWTKKHFGDTRPRAIVMTHGHFDHAGALEALAERWDVPVYADPLELPYLTGQKQYPPPNPKVGGGIMAVLSPLYPRGPYNIGNRARPFPADGTIPDMPGWKWVHTPGHTEGHVSFWREEDRVLLVGDAFCTTKQESLLAIAQQRPELHGPPAYYTSDWDAAKASVEKLAELRPTVVAPGHGLPMAGPEVGEALQILARDFDRVARPQEPRAA